MGITRTMYLSSDKDLELYEQAKELAEQQNKSISRFLLDSIKATIIREGNESNHSSLDDIGVIRKLNTFFDEQTSQKDLQLQEAFISPRNYVLTIKKTNGEPLKKAFNGILVAFDTETFESVKKKTMIFQTLKNKIVVYEQFWDLKKQTLKSDFTVYEDIKDVPSLGQKLDAHIKEYVSVEQIDVLDI